VTRLQTLPVTRHNSQNRATARDYSARGSARSLSPLSAGECGGSFPHGDASPSPHGELSHRGLEGAETVPAGVVPMLALGQEAASAAVSAYTASRNW
jgi:hypothetical protein